MRHSATARRATSYPRPVRQVSALASAFPSHSQCRIAAWPTRMVAGLAENLHPQVSASCGAHKQYSRCLDSGCTMTNLTTFATHTGSGTGRLHRERRTATAGGLGIGVLDDELRTLQAFGVIDLGTDQILIAHGVDEQ